MIRLNTSGLILILLAWSVAHADGPLTHITSPVTDQDQTDPLDENPASPGFSLSENIYTRAVKTCESISAFESTCNVLGLDETELETARHYANYKTDFDIPGCNDKSRELAKCTRTTPVHVTPPATGLMDPTDDQNGSK